MTAALRQGWHGEVKTGRAPPGCKLYALIFPCDRLDSSLAKRILAALASKYAAEELNFAGSGCAMVLRSTPPNACAALDTNTTRGVKLSDPVASSFGASSFVKRNGPNCAVASCVSMPSAVSLNGPPPAAAL